MLKREHGPGTGGCIPQYARSVRLFLVDNKRQSSNDLPAFLGRVGLARPYASTPDRCSFGLPLPKVPTCRGRLTTGRLVR